MKKGPGVLLACGVWKGELGSAQLMGIRGNRHRGLGPVRSRAMEAKAGESQPPSSLTRCGVREAGGGQGLRQESTQARELCV